MSMSRCSLLKCVRAISGVTMAYNTREWITCTDSEALITTKSPTPTDNSASRASSSHGKVNPLDCIQPACSSKIDLLKEAFKRQKLKAAEKISKESTEEVLKSSTAETSSIPSNAKHESAENQPTTADHTNVVEDAEAGFMPPLVLASNCPLDREELGRSTWDLIHTVAAHYPDEPTEIDKQNARNFMSSLSYLYPCEICREDFKESVTNKPPQ